MNPIVMISSVSPMVTWLVSGSIDERTKLLATTAKIPPTAKPNLGSRLLGFIKSHKNATAADRKTVPSNLKKYPNPSLSIGIINSALE